MTKRLVIAPHVDDDVLGCGGILDAETTTFYCGVDLHHVVTSTERHSEACAVAERTGGRFWWPTAPFGTATSDATAVSSLTESIQRPGCSYYFTTRRVNHYDVPSLIADIESTINEEQPEEVYLPWPSYNQDHRAVYEAALVALRPHDRNHFVPRVFIYEGSQVAYWDWANPGAAFRPTYFVAIDIEEKLARYACMRSQVRGMRSPEALRALAVLRGGEIGVQYAEAFQIIRWAEGAGDGRARLREEAGGVEDVPHGGGRGDDPAGRLRSRAGARRWPPDGD